MKINNRTTPSAQGESRNGAYIAPAIELIEQVYGNGLMQSWSTGIGTGAGPGPGAKPGGDWGYDDWAEPTTTDAATPTDDTWGLSD